MLRALQALPVRHDALVQGERILRLFRVAVRGGEAGAGADRIRVLLAIHAFPVGERALAEGDRFLVPPGFPAGVREAAAALEEYREWCGAGRPGRCPA